MSHHELARLRELSAKCLLSMTQVDSLFAHIERLTVERERLTKDREEARALVRRFEACEQSDWVDDAEVSSMFKAFGRAITRWDAEPSEVAAPVDQCAPQGKAAQAHCASCEKLQKTLRLDSPWSFISVLERLADAADHLLKGHDCDAHGWEGIGLARNAAREIVRSLVGAEPSEVAVAGAETLPGGSAPGRISATAASGGSADKPQDIFRTMSKAELDAYEGPSEDDIRRALAEGREDALAITKARAGSQAPARSGPDADPCEGSVGDAPRPGGTSASPGTVAHSPPGEPVGADLYATTCVDDDCPLPEHKGPCPDERTLDMWRTEAQRCRAMIGRLISTVKSRDESIASYRAMGDRTRARIDALRESATELLAALPKCDLCRSAATHRLVSGDSADDGADLCETHRVTRRGGSHDEIAEKPTAAPAARLKALLGDAPEKGGDRG